MSDTNSTTIVENAIENTTENNVENTDTTSEAFDKQVKMIEDVIKNLRTRLADLRKMKKEIATLEKQSKTVSKKKAPRSPSDPKKQSGFRKPVLISDDLCEFLGMEKGSRVARSDVTKKIGAYVSEHSLKNPKNGREFQFNNSEASKKFQKILDVSGIETGKPIGFLVLQKCIKHHFIKETTDAPAKETPTKDTEKPTKETKSVKKPEHKVEESKSETKPESKTEVKTETKVEESKPESKTEVKKVIKKIIKKP